MAILGTTDIGRGRYYHTLDHDPSVVATDGLKTSVAWDVSTDLYWLKTDDGVTTNWINLRDAFNTNTSNTFTNILSGITNVGDALDILDNLNWANLGGGIVGGCVITQHNQSQPYSEVTSTSWTTLAAMAFEGGATYPISVMWSVVSLSGMGEGAMRIFDVTNGNTIGLAEWTNPVQHIEIDTLANVPATNAVFEIQLRKVGQGGKPRLWSCQIK
jgi:hypothetical protein